jgi:beta-glucosidase
MTHGDRESRIDQAIARLDLAQKVRLLSGDGMFQLHAETDIGLAPLQFSDGPTGVRGDKVVGGRISCLLPNATLLAQHWNPAVMEEVGEVLADEAEDQQVHVVLGPTINLHRGPLGGRLFEAFSEDPLLTGVLAAGYVRSLQARGIGASAKHYLANESETERFTVDSVITEGAMRETYLLPFEIVLADANPWTVMASYNRVNGITATEHVELLTDVLKEEWQYDGLVMSDWFATTSTVASANSGLDLVMPGMKTPWGDALVEAVQAGEVAEAVIDEHLRRLLRLADRVGGLDSPREWRSKFPAPHDEVRRIQLRDLAAGGMAVLVNKNDTLPLAGGAAQVVVIGRHALDPVAQGGGSAVVRPPHIVAVSDALIDALGSDRVTVVDGVEVRTRPVAPREDALRDPETGMPGIRVVGRDASGVVIASEHLEVPEVSLGDGVWLDRAVSIELSAEVVLTEPARMQIGVRGPGKWELTAPGHHEQVTVGVHAGPGGGLHRPKGHAIDVNLEPGAVITAVTAARDGMRIIGLVARPAPRTAAEVIAEATTAAATADVAVIVVGLTQEQETEGVDKSTLALPGEQDALVAAVAAVAKRTVVVVNAATPVLMPWLSDVDAVLWAGLPGQEAGAAVAAALTGEIEPSGRLVTTFPARDGEGPAWSTTPVDGRLEYSEGTKIGYRGWHASGAEPLFWFGHGLGYGEWRYDHVEVTDADDRVATVDVTVTNTGRHSSRETVQVYLQPHEAEQPVRLIGWSCVTLASGGTATVTVPCDARLQRRWDTDNHSWRPLTGGNVLVARGLGDIRLTASRITAGAE